MLAVPLAGCATDGTVSSPSTPERVEKAEQLLDQAVRASVLNKILDEQLGDVIPGINAFLQRKGQQLTLAQEQEIRFIMKQELAYVWTDIRENLSESFAKVLNDADLEALAGGRSGAEVQTARRKLDAAKGQIVRDILPDIVKFRNRALERIFSSDLFQGDFNQTI